MAQDSLEAFSRLHAHPHEANRAWKARTGGKVVGYLGRDVPPEMIAAAGMLPVEILGEQGGSADAISPFLPQSFVEPAFRSIASRLIDGTYDYLDFLVISPKPAVNVTLFEFQREARRIFDDLAFPETYFMDFFHSPKLTASLFNRESLRRLAHQLERWSGQAVTDAALCASIADFNIRRRRFSQLLELSRVSGPKIAGSHALAIAAALCTAPYDDQVRLLEGVIDGCVDLPTLDGVPVIYSGSATTGIEPYLAIEAGGAQIVADDQDAGAMAMGWLVDEGVAPIDALADRAQHMLPDALRQDAVRRSAHLKELASKTGARAVLFNILAIDHAAMLDYPRIRDELHAAGIATADFGARLYNDQDYNPLTAQTADLLTRLPHSLAA